MKRILSITGGGIRGVIPAVALVELEKIAGKRCADVFNFVGGTSTGALIAAAIAADVPATEIRDVYLHRTKEIFSPTGRVSDAILLARGYRYGVEKLAKVVGDTLGFSSMTALNSLSVDIMLTAIAEADGHPWYFVKDNPSNAQTTGHLPLGCCCTASGAAPIYFDSYTMPDGRKFVDGGLGVVANPVYQTCIEAFEFGAGKYQPEDSIVVSLGTGIPPAPRQPSGSLLSKLEWVLDVSLDAPREQQKEVVERLYQPRLKGFHVVDIPMLQPIDMADVASLPALQAYGNKLAAQTDWEKILEL